MLDLHRRARRARGRGKIPQLSRVFRRNLPPPGKIRFELPQLRESQRAGNIGKPVVESQHHHLIKPLAGFLPLARFAADAMIAKVPQRLGQRESLVVTMPPSPVVRCFTGWKLKTVISARLPTRLPRYSAPSAWQASSINTARFCLRDLAQIRRAPRDVPRNRPR